MPEFEYGTLQSSEFLGPEAMVQINTRMIGAIVDTGAVLTAIPEHIINRLGPLSYSLVTVRLANGEERDARTAMVRIRVTSDDIGNAIDISEPIEVVVIDNSFNRRYALIGRNILNRYRLVLDGPQEIWRIEQYEHS